LKQKGDDDDTEAVHRRYSSTFYRDVMHGGALPYVQEYRLKKSELDQQRGAQSVRSFVWKNVQTFGGDYLDPNTGELYIKYVGYPTITEVQKKVAADNIRKKFLQYGNKQKIKRK